MASPKADRALQFVRRFWIDLGLAAGFLGCLAGFVRNSIDLEAASGIGARVAIQEQGLSPQAGPQPDLQRCETRHRIPDLDAIWVGPGENAVIRTEEGSLLELEERTFLVLRKPFKPRARIEDRFRLIAGRIIVKGTEEPKKVEVPKGFPELPTAKSKPQEADPARKVYPEPGSHVLLKAERELPVTWVVPVTGFLAIQNRVTGQMRYLPIERASHARVELPAGAHYVWQVLDEQRRVQVGPYDFELLGAAGAPAVIREGLKQKGTPPPLDVH